VVNFFLDGLGKQVATFKGTVILTIVGLFTLDVMAKGSIGIIAFCLEKCNAALEIVVSAVKDGGWPIIVLAMIALLWKKEGK